MPFKDFDAAVAADQREQVEFTLKGQRFHAVAQDDLPWTAGMKLAAAPEEGPEQIKALDEWFSAAIVPDDRDRFQAVLDTISNNALDKLLTWMVGVYTGRPTEEPANSQPGSSSTGPTARVVRLWAPADQQPEQPQAASTG